jgi:transcription elongation factor Elf1
VAEKESEEMTIPTPTRCPRCGNEHFIKTQVDAGSAGGISIAKGVFRCTQCSLTFDGQGWADEKGDEWTMAESGT